ncbi:GOLD domain [Sesbania bispinosa]|nr:GOLD domain [Sesbania bispinosa]
MEAATFSTPSFKEDTYLVSHLKSSERKALQELKDKLVACETNHSSMWGVPLLGGDDRADVLLLKFLRARDFRVGDALNMLLKCLAWRKEFGADNIVDEDLGFKELEGVFSREESTFSISSLGGVNSSDSAVTDLKDMPKRELRVASNQILSLFQDNYPEMVARKIFINVPWYFSMLYSMFSPFLTQRTKSKFVLSKEGNTAETLYKFIRPEDIPVRYGGLSRPKWWQTIMWDIVVGGWDLEYSAEFVPNAEGSYTIAVEKPRKIEASEEAIHNSFTSKEAGKMVLSVDNSASRKRKVAAYRYVVRKCSTQSEMQLSLK